MSGGHETASNRARLALRPGPLAGPVLARVVGMLAARAHSPIDRLDDALLAADAIAAHAPAHAVDDMLVVGIASYGGGLDLTVGPLHAGGAEAVLAASELPGVGNVLERVADELASGPAPDSDGEELRLRIGFGP